MRSEKKAETPSMKKKSASTWGARVEAWGGKSGRPHITLAALPAAEDDDRRAEGEHRRHPAQADQVHHHRAVLAGGRIVVEAEEQHLIDCRADPVRRCLHEPEPAIAGRGLHPVEVAGEVA